MELTVEQKRALAMAAARKRANVDTKSSDNSQPQGEYVQPSPPEGMVFDPRTGRMVDTKALGEKMVREHPIATGAGRMASGFPILGAAFERYGGAGDPVRQGVIDQSFKEFDQQNPKTSFGLRVGGAVAGVAPLVAMAPAAFGAGATQGLGASSAMSSLSGAALGGADAAVRSDFDTKQTAVGTVAGGVLGGAAPVVAKGIGAGINTVGGMLGVGNRARANALIAESLRRAGMSADDVADDMARASADDQGMFIAADALGNPGQRMLSGVARTPGDTRKTIVDTLLRRQSGQGDRLVNAISEGFDAADTAAQRMSGLKAARKTAANTNYEAARQGAGPVNLNNAIDTIDSLMKRNPILGESALAKTEIGSRLSGLRAKMAKGGEQLIDFDTVLNVKQDLGGVIEGLKKSGKEVPSSLSKVYGELDNALEASSAGYRAANDTFRAQSKVIEAIDKGKAATSGRLRAGDTIPQFQSMTPDEQAAFRSGYADPLMARIESASMSPTTNKARALITEKTGMEFPAFASPGRADHLGNRIAREQRMFDTSSAVLGGSRTADNLADTAEIASFDPTIIGNLIQGRFGAAAMSALQKSGDVAGGRNTAVKDIVAKALIENNPDIARQVFSAAISKSDKSRVVKEALVRALMQGPAMQAIGN